jgi:hypothetical protein
MNIPNTIRAGDYATWDEDLSADYVPTTHTLSLKLSGPAQYTVNAATNGTGYRFTIESAISAAWLPGIYKCVAYVTTIATPVQRTTLLTKQFEILTDEVAETDVVDGRTIAQRMIDAIEAVMESRATKEQSGLSTPNGIQLNLLSPAELRQEWLRWKQIRTNELADERIANGEDTGGQVLVCFPAIS